MQVKSPPDDPLVLKQELAKIDNLFRQNLNAVPVVPLYIIPYCYASWNVLSHIFLIGWSISYLFVVLLRVILALVWRRRLPSIKSGREANRYWMTLNFFFFLSGACWIPIAWMFPTATHYQQLATAMCLVFMTAGAVCMVSGSLLSTYLLTLPMFLVWIAGMLLSSEPTLKIFGGIATIYYGVGVLVSIALSRYLNQSLRTMTKYLETKEALRESAESLTMALASSGALTWTWDLKGKTICCEGDLSALGISERSLSGTEQQYLTLLDPAMRNDIRERMMAGMGIHGEIETEHQLQIPGHGVLYMAVRGRALRGENGEVVAFKGICWDATGKRTEEALRHERDVQEAANKAKSVFLANASHEMRTPLAAISGYTEALLDSTLPPQIRHDLQVVQRTGKYLTSLVNDFLDLSRIETGQLYIQKNTIQPEKEITEILQMLKPGLDAKNVKLILEVTTLLPEHIETDLTRLRQIMINMLSNATKYTQQGQVRVRVSYDLKSDGKATLSIRVIDTGVGITENVRQNLFRPFARGETAFIKRTEGAGLGLALSRSLARAMGGDLQLVRSSPGQGSEFEFTLSLEPIAAMSVKVIEQKREAFIQPVSALPLDGMHLLVAEDSEDLRELMERILESKGAKVDSCGDGAQVVERALEHSYDVILMDINMPVMDGYQATAALRARGYTKPVVALTAHASIEHRQMSLEAGCDAYLSKPINSNSLIDILRKSVFAAKAYTRAALQAEQ